MIELIEVLDPVSGEPVGRRKPKDQIHRDGDWHRAAHVWIVTPDRRVVLQQRSMAKVNHPGMWDVSCAGHVSAGESAIDAAIRETEEELGVLLDSDELKPLGVTRESCVLNHGTYIDNEIHDLFLVERDIARAALRLQPGEVDDVRLVTIDELGERVARRDPTLVPHWEDYRLLLGRAGHL